MANATEQERKKKIEALKAALFSNSSEDVLKAVKKSKQMGDASFVTPLLEAYLNTDNEKIKTEIALVLGSLKVSGVTEPFMESLKNDRFAPCHGEILSFMWNSGLNPVEHLADIVKVTLQGDFMQTFEGVTLIENMEGPHKPEQVTESLIVLREYISNAKDEEKKDLVVSLYNVLSELEDQV